MRPVDLAREHGLSTQAVRNYESAGILPPAGRTAAGYRVYTPVHAAALRAFLSLVAGHGHAMATAIMQAVNRGAVDEALRLIDESHARLLEDRRTLEAVEAALRDLAPAPPPEPGGCTSARSPGGSAYGPPRCANGRRPGWSGRAAIRAPATGCTARPTSGTPGWCTSYGGAVTCWRRSPR